MKPCLTIRSLFILAALLILSSFTPPGTVKLKKTDKYLDYSEVTNLDWMEYKYYMVRTSSEVLTKEQQEAYMADSVTWSRLYPIGWRQHFTVSYGPVVGITHEQAEAYCRWRSYIVTEIIGKGKRKVVYRLPTPDELKEIIVSGGVNAAQENRSDEVVKDLKKGHRKKLSYLLSNVYEYTSEEGVYLNGGTYKEGEEPLISTLPDDAHLGFRCIAEVNELE